MTTWWAIPLAALLMTGCVAEPARVSREAVKVDGQGLAVSVNAAAPWVDTGVDLKAGEAWRLAAEGRWSIGPFCGVTGPDGAGVSPLCAGDSLGIGATGSTLIGRIGASGKPFAVGNGRDIVVETEGRLFLAAYDMIPFDNTGTVTVTVRPLGAAAQTAAPARKATGGAAVAAKPTLPGGGPSVIPSFAELTDHGGYSVKALTTYPHFRLHAKMKAEARARRAEGERLMAEGDVALGTGEGRKALAAYAAAYPWLEADPDKGREKALIGRMASALAGLRVKPAVPMAAHAEIEAAGRRWRAAVDPSQATEAVAAIEKSLRAAPWWSGGHLELGLARTAASQHLRAKISYENFLALQPTGPAAESLRARWSEIEARATDDRLVNRWKGLWVANDTWTQAGAIMEAQLDGAVVNFVVVTHTEVGKANGWKPGDVMFTGTIEGDKVTGWAVVRGECRIINRPDMCKACFGDEMWMETTLTMRADGNTLDGLSQWYWPPRPKAGGTQCVFAKSTRSTSTHEIGRIAVRPEEM